MADSPLPVVRVHLTLEECNAVGDLLEAAIPSADTYSCSVVPVGEEVTSADSRHRNVKVTLQAQWDDDDDSSYIAFRAPRTGYWALVARNEDGVLLSRSEPRSEKQDHLVLFPRKG